MDIEQMSLHDLKGLREVTIVLLRKSYTLEHV